MSTLQCIWGQGQIKDHLSVAMSAVHHVCCAPPVVTVILNLLNVNCGASYPNLY